ncbi:cobyric acid synthase [Aeromicrobium sp. Leaf350]|uniref:cobyric acid synthase n=1 Tax=Aeromicrobium sp. Leaf350 TaxID=2876565 RepID=UPI001E36EF23|nr:cobyric acid synthase [Aeromicrobium sp. Leaf350]
MRGLLVAGTTSDAGKTVVTTAICRAFARRGVKVAPFKSQNMSNNSMVVRAEVEGGSATTHGEIGRAQWIQAVAAGAVPEAAMNPVLLKPGSDHTSHVVVMGKPAGTLGARSFVDGGRAHLAEAAFAALDDLASRYDVIVAEGAGSPTEINLRGNDYVNMGLARHAGLPTVVVGDIDRGGVFAALFGTVALLEAADQDLVAGFVMNKFRGDVSLLAPGIDRLAELSGRPTLGVLPWHPDVWLDSEDALDLEGRRSGDRDDALRVAVVRLPRISNFTDVDALGIEPGIDLVFASQPHHLDGADLVVLPGTRATIGDLAWLRERGLAAAVLRHAAAGGAVLGICGGFQMLGRVVADPDGVEGPAGAEVEGLGLLDVRTDFGAEKVLRLPTGEALGQSASGYEIHHGRITRGDGVEDFLGGARSGAVFGTMWHGSLESDGLRRALLAEVATAVGRSAPVSDVSFAARREARLDLLGDLAEEHLDVDRLLALALTGAPAGLRRLAPGAPA